MSYKIPFFLVWIALNSVLLAQTAPDTPSDYIPNPSYRLNFGDRLNVGVFGEPELTVQQLIDQSGKIRLPLIGDVTVAGHTVREAESLIEKTYRQEEILKSPQVTLAMAAYAPREVMVLGAVRSPGAFQFPPDVVSLDIRDVLARQGGFTPVAKSDSVAVTRRQSNGQEITTSVDVERMMFGRTRKNSNSPPVLILPGDRIYVPERLF